MRDRLRRIRQRAALGIGHRPAGAGDIALHDRIVGVGHVDGEQKGRRRHRGITGTADAVPNDLIAIALIGDAGLIAGARAVARGVVDGIVADGIAGGDVPGGRGDRVAVGVEIDEPDADIVAHCDGLGHAGVGLRRAAEPRAADEEKAGARRTPRPGIGVADHQVPGDVRVRAEADLDAGLRDEVDGSLADHGIAGHGRAGERAAHHDAALLVVPDHVVLDVAARRAGEGEVDADPVLRPVERRLADIVDGRAGDIDLSAVIDDAIVVGAVNACLVERAVGARAVVDADIAAGRIDVAVDLACGVDQRRREIDAVADEAGRRAGLRAGERQPERRRQGDDEIRKALDHRFLQYACTTMPRDAYGCRSEANFRLLACAYQIPLTSRYRAAAFGLDGSARVPCAVAGLVERLTHRVGRSVDRALGDLLRAL